MNQESHNNPQGRSASAARPRAVDSLFISSGVVSQSSGIGQRLRLDMERLFGRDPKLVSGRTADDREVPQSAERSDNAAPRLNVEICRILNQCIADCLHLQSQCRQAQWHLTDSPFLEQRSICTQAIQLIEHHVDLLGHRVVQLDGVVESTVGQVVERSGLNEYPTKAKEPQTHIDSVTFAFWLVSGAMREDCGELCGRGDASSHNLLDQSAASIERCLELLESFNSGPIMLCDRIKDTT